MHSFRQEAFCKLSAVSDLYVTPQSCSKTLSPACSTYSYGEHEYIYIYTQLQKFQGTLDASNLSISFDILLTVHLNLIVEINRLNVQNFVFFVICLLYASTCFEHYVLIIRRSKLYYIASGIITPAGGRQVHGTATCRA